MSGTMRAMMLHEGGKPLELEQVPIPAPGPGEVLVKLAVASVGLTVVNYTDRPMGGAGAGAPKLPRIPGHEITGTGSSPCRTSLPSCQLRPRSVSVD
ncbi:MAG: hypothetical protein IT307_01490, partial [Chloroflexi bacterium]|nr:hypothetical protein [Chloroflexota bacterium]